MAGQGAKKRGNAKKAQRKQAAKKMAKKAAKSGLPPAAETLTIPDVTENDLLAFQLTHFGDDTKPEIWVVDPETAVNYEPDMEQEEDDELGYYEDGVKRTLTDGQIAMFRHSEIEQLTREGKLVREEDTAMGGAEEDSEITSSVSEASSIEEELADLAKAAPLAPPPLRSKERQLSKSSRSDTPVSTETKQKQRKQDIPYGERHKRKWEDYIDEEDPVHGSLTHRRVAREMDEQYEESVDLDY
ncbi:hypothetical protein LTR37_004682 [Vermiconidia calcicola]|uniref:Uncharacterized protein n=1 Tax=Vermiconidia calcicola TaxID=1690605 RepID=A0ACC3NLY2_9PEZI|nr:hypothetical protein LTR37_004682 [Vermiconidia calcicola]